MGIGIDIIEIKRIEALVRHWGNRFLNRVFTDKELNEWRFRGKRAVFLAGRFATKEAFLKASGSPRSGIKGIRWKEIEILGDQFEKPTLWFNGKKVENIDLSISHTQELAISVVMTNITDK